MTQTKRPAPPQDRPSENNITVAADSTAIRCQRCLRGLRSPLSVARAHGPVCWHRRSEAAARLARLDCGCADPWPCRCTEPPLTDRQLDGWREAAEHIMGRGDTPLLPVEILRSLYRRGGADRALAQRLHAATGGVIA